MLTPTENSRIQGLFKAFECYSSTPQGRLIFKDFSRKPSKFKYFFMPVRTLHCHSKFLMTKLSVVYSEVLKTF